MKKQPGILRKWFLKIYLWAAERLYHQFAWAYEAVAWLVSLGHWSGWRVDALNYVGSGRIIELGCGTGALLMEMQDLGYDVVGVEPSRQMLRILVRRARQKGQAVRFVRGYAQSVPFGSGCFETVLSTFPSNYILQAKTFTEVHRILTPKGRWVIVGLGVVFKSVFHRWLTGLVFGNFNRAALDQFSKRAEENGFSAQWVDHEMRNYTLPILILEKP